jgi:hypothetical protein
MAFAGLKKDDEVANVIAYLKGSSCRGIKTTAIARSKTVPPGTVFFFAFTILRF